MIKTYSELISLPTFKERFEYLKIGGAIGKETFGVNRYLNQEIYHSTWWCKEVRPKIIVRDNGRDLALDGYDIFGPVYIHHINPLTLEDIEESKPIVYDPENLVCVSFLTHQAIHYGSFDRVPALPTERKPNDTIPWR